MNYLNVLRIIRVPIVAGGLFAFILGVLLALVEGGDFVLIPTILGYGVVLLGDLSTHYSNDYFDVEIDKHLKTKKFFSGSHILVYNPNLRQLILIISLILLLTSIGLAALTVLLFRIPIEFFMITLIANLLGWFYSAPPLRLCSRSLGEIAIAIATGFIIPGIGYLCIKSKLDSIFFFLSLPFMIYGFILSLSLEAPDIENDQERKKRTFAVLIGKRNIFFVILLLAFLATLTFFVLPGHIISKLFEFRIFSFIPLIVGIVGFITTFKEKNLNRFSALNILALFIFIILINIYCILLLL